MNIWQTSIKNYEHAWNPLKFMKFNETHNKKNKKYSKHYESMKMYEIVYNSCKSLKTNNNNQIYATHASQWKFMKPTKQLRTLMTTYANL